MITQRRQPGCALWELCDAQAFQENPRAGEAGQLKVSEAGKNLRILEVEKVEMLGEIQKPHLLAMFIILVCTCVARELP